MLTSLRSMIGLHVQASDGRAGTLRDFFFDDSTWTVRHVVLDIGDLLFGRRLIDPIHIGTPDLDQRTLPVVLSRAQIEQQPPAGADPPVADQWRNRLGERSGWSPIYATPSGGSGMPMAAPVIVQAPQTAKAPTGDPHLRRFTEVSHYSVQATDGRAGRLWDLLAQEAPQPGLWKMRYLVIRTGWWPRRRRVLISVSRVRHVVWAERRVYVDFARTRLARDRSGRDDHVTPAAEEQPRRHEHAIE